MLTNERVPQAVNERASHRQQLQEAVIAGLAQNIIGVLALGHDSQTRRFARGQKWQYPLKRAHLGTLASGIPIKAQDRLIMQLPQQGNLFLGQRGPERGHRRSGAAALDGDHIHIALTDNERQFAAQPLARLNQTIENGFLGKGRPLARIQIFWLGITKRPGAKGNHPALLILNRKHHPVAEIIEQRAIAVRFSDHPGSQHVGIAEPTCCKRRPQPPARRITKPKGADCLGGKPAIADIARRVLAIITAKRVLKKARGRLQNIEGGLALLRLGRVLGRAVRHRNAGHSGKPLNRLHEVKAVSLTQEGNGIAMNTAAKTMVKAIIINHRKRRCLLRVEGAQPVKAPAFADQLDALADDIGQRNALAQILDEFRWHCHL